MNSWPSFQHHEISNRVQYRACSQKTAWRMVNHHQSVWGALFSQNGAKALFDETSGLYHDRVGKHGPPIYVVVWEAGEEWALLTNGVNVALIDSHAIEEIDTLTDEGLLTSSEIRRQLDQLFNRASKRTLAGYEAS